MTILYNSLPFYVFCAPCVCLPLLQ